MMPIFLYHAAPLHYLPSILSDGALYAQSILASKGIAPRVTATLRDQRLGLADYVHLALRSDSPLLADKLRKGYPHALIVFEGAQTLALPETALLPYNTKAWRTRACYMPITDPGAQTEMLRHHAQGRYPSLEALVKYGLSLDTATQIAFVNAEEYTLVAQLLQKLPVKSHPPLQIEPALFPRTDGYQPVTWEAIKLYFGDCERAGKVLPPPRLPFD